MVRPVSYNVEEVLQKATMLFWAKGYKATSLDQILQATGLNKHSLYNAFGGKEKLFLEAMQTYEQQFAKELLQLLEAKPLGLTSIKKFFSSLIESPAAGRGCLMLNSIREQAHLEEAATKKAYQYFDRVEKGFLANLEAAATSQPKEQSQFILMFLHGVITAQQMNKDPLEIKKSLEKMLSHLN